MMRFLLVISLGIVCLARAFPDWEDEPEVQIPEEDKPLIQKLAQQGSTMTFTLMTEPSKVMMKVVYAILDTKKADQHILDEIQNRINKANSTTSGDESSEGDNHTPLPDYLKDLSKMFKIYSKPANLEKRIRFNLWTNGQFDMLMGNYYQMVADQQKSYLEAVKTTINKLSEATKKSHKDSIEKFNNSVKERDMMDAANSLFGELTYGLESYRSAPNFNDLEDFRKQNNKFFW